MGRGKSFSFKRRELTDPEHIENQPVPREAYVELMKSLTRLNALRRAKKERETETGLYTIECYQCGEVIGQRPVTVHKELCEACREMNRLARLMDQQAKNNRKRQTERTEAGVKARRKLVRYKR